MSDLSGVAEYVVPTLDVRPAGAAQPRVIQQFTSLFLLARAGELWRVYDSAAVDGIDRRMPTERTQLRYRLFLSLSGRSEIRAYELTDDRPGGIDAESLQHQLDRARLI